MPKSTNPDDPRGLIADAYRIDGIDDAQCRSIFLDWSLDQRIPDPVGAAARLSREMGAQHPGHPMSLILEASASAPSRGRRGGRAGRR